MMENAGSYLEMASGALSRGDYLSALRFARQASVVPEGQAAVRCDAYVLSALSSLEMGMAEDALAFAVGAHLSARRARCEEREERAASLVAFIVSRCPHLADGETMPTLH